MSSPTSSARAAARPASLTDLAIGAIDASLRTRLEEMRRSLETVPIDLTTAVEA